MSHPDEYLEADGSSDNGEQVEESNFAARAGERRGDSDGCSAGCNQGHAFGRICRRRSCVGSFADQAWPDVYADGVQAIDRQCQRNGGAGCRSSRVPVRRPRRPGLIGKLKSVHDGSPPNKKAKRDPSGVFCFAAYVGFLLAVNSIVPPALMLW